MSDASKHYASKIYGNPKEYFTTDIMERIEKYANKEYQYGGMTTVEVEPEVVVDEEKEGLAETLTMIDADVE